MNRLVRNSIGGIAAASLAATPVLAEKADQLTSIAGLEAAEAEGALRARGFEYADGETNEQGYTYTYWWDAEDKNCVRAEAYNGRVESIVDATDKDCNHGGLSTGAVVGIAAGAALLGALLLGRNKDKDDDDRPDPGSGYTSDAQFADLKGARAAGGMSELERRGFKQVDNFTSGNTRYSIQWRPQSQQCLQVTIADGRFYDLRDIGRHPNCQGGYYAGGGGYKPGTGYVDPTPVQVADLRNSRASTGMDELQRRGFYQVDNFTTGNTRYSIQWRPASRQCLQVTIANGRFSDLRGIGKHPKCQAELNSGTSGSNWGGAARYDDLIGMDGRQARGILGDRGFTRVQRFGDDRTRYSIMWRSQSRQCLQVMIVDDRTEDIRDIGSHPDCRD